MKREELYKIGLSYAKEIGLTEVEFYYEYSKSLSLGVFEGEVNKFSRSSTQGISVRGIFNDKFGYAYTESLDENSVKLAIENAKENAKYIDSNDPAIIFEGEKEYIDINLFDKELEKVAIEDKIDFLMELENKALELDEKVYKANYLMYGDGYNEIEIVNSRGLNLHEKRNHAYAYISLVTKDGENFRTGDSFIVGKDFSSFDANELAKKAVLKALAKSGACAIASKSYHAIFENLAFADLIGACMGIFSAKNIQKGMSGLKGKQNEMIASSVFSICDNPHMENQVSSASFDAEGVGTIKKYLIKDGKLINILYNLETAYTDKVKSSGNASRGSYKSTVGISGYNVFVEPGEKSLDEMMSDVGEGVLITELQGLHAGLNAVSGDFSLLAQGFYFKDGKKVKPFSDVTVSANLYEMLKQINVVGNDLDFAMPSSETVGSPSIDVGIIDISGE